MQGTPPAWRVLIYPVCQARINARPVEDPLTHFVIVRSDLPAGAAAAQMVHAAGESSPGNLPEGTYAVVLAAPNEDALVALSARLAASGFEHVRIVECDAPYAGQLMALGLRPILRSKGRRALSSLPLYRGPVSGEVAQSRAAVN